MENHGRSGVYSPLCLPTFHKKVSSFRVLLSASEMLLAGSHNFPEALDVEGILSSPVMDSYSGSLGVASTATIFWTILAIDQYRHIVLGISTSAHRRVCTGTHIGGGERERGGGVDISKTLEESILIYSYVRRSFSSYTYLLIMYRHPSTT